MPKLIDQIPDADVLLALPPEELGGYVLQHFHSLGNADKFSMHRANFATYQMVQEYPQDRQNACKRALMEAWNYLEKEGLIVPEPDNSAPVYILSRLGKRLRAIEDLYAFRHASLFPKDTVHPDIREKVYPLFLRKDYETAVFQAFKSVEIAVRNAAGKGYENLYGVDLVRRAFSTTNGPLTDMSEVAAEREALQALFAGAIGRFKNPSSHRHMEVTSPIEAIEMIQIASHLLRLVEDRSHKMLGNEMP